MVFAEPAEQDLDAIITYIAQDDPVAAEKVFRAIVTATGRLCDFPNLGHAGRVAGTRELSITALPYIVVYQVSSDMVIVVAIFHAARDLARVIRERGAIQQGKDH